VIWVSRVFPDYFLFGMGKPPDLLSGYPARTEPARKVGPEIPSKGAFAGGNGFFFSGRAYDDEVITRGKILRLISGVSPIELGEYAEQCAGELGSAISTNCTLV